ncbi:MAG: bifunctional nuclease family protein [Chitinophagales bacterium]|nr:bifunctional nuclease family protein [Chitinophagales bacterium]MDW8418934.1 bifunctional nuclease family protein [Chitinophagales bacterium]
MKKIELEIIALSHSVSQTHSFAVVLGEVGGNRRLPIVIGGFEAQAIAVALDNMKPTRPLTHDLMKSICDTFGIQLEYVYICKLHEGVFYSNLVCKAGDEYYEIDSRTSDALALAVRFDCPIYVEESILIEAGVEADVAEEKMVSGEEEEQKRTATSGPMNLSEMKTSDLQAELQKALENEDYERAARIRDELNRRK